MAQITHTVGARSFIVNTIIVHGTLTRPDWMPGSTAAAKLAQLQAWHEEDGGTGQRYHYLIDRDGTVAQGLPLSEVGAHCLGRNKGTVGVILVGGHGAKVGGKFEDKFTSAQDLALKSLAVQIDAQTKIRLIAGHSEYDGGACPGFDARDRYRYLLGEEQA